MLRAAESKAAEGPNYDYGSGFCNALCPCGIGCGGYADDPVSPSRVSSWTSEYWEGNTQSEVSV
jgi:hypothetical protein